MRVRLREHSAAKRLRSGRPLEEQLEGIVVLDFETAFRGSLFEKYHILPLQVACLDTSVLRFDLLYQLDQFRYEHELSRHHDQIMDIDTFVREFEEFCKLQGGRCEKHEEDAEQEEEEEEEEEYSAAAEALKAFFLAHRNAMNLDIQNNNMEHSRHPHRNAGRHRQDGQQGCNRRDSDGGYGFPGRGDLLVVGYGGFGGGNSAGGYHGERGYGGPHSAGGNGSDVAHADGGYGGYGGFGGHSQDAEGDGHHDKGGEVVEEGWEEFPDPNRSSLYGKTSLLDYLFLHVEEFYEFWDSRRTVHLTRLGKNELLAHESDDAIAQQLIGFAKLQGVDKSRRRKWRVELMDYDLVGTEGECLPLRMFFWQGQGHTGWSADVWTRDRNTRVVLIAKVRPNDSETVVKVMDTNLEVAEGRYRPHGDVPTMLHLTRPLRLIDRGVEPELALKDYVCEHRLLRAAVDDRDHNHDPGPILGPTAVDCRDQLPRQGLEAESALNPIQPKGNISENSRTDSLPQCHHRSPFPGPQSVPWRDQVIDQRLQPVLALDYRPKGGDIGENSGTPRRGPLLGPPPVACRDQVIDQRLQPALALDYQPEGGNIGENSGTPRRGPLLGPPPVACRDEVIDQVIEHQLLAAFDDQPNGRDISENSGTGLWGQPDQCDHHGTFFLGPPTFGTKDWKSLVQLYEASVRLDDLRYSGESEIERLIPVAARMRDLVLVSMDHRYFNYIATELRLHRSTLKDSLQLTCTQFTRIFEGSGSPWERLPEELVLRIVQFLLPQRLLFRPLLNDQNSALFRFGRRQCLR
ncbi:hypothetical protein CBR_g38685 [Chara braunii]|uniref:Uncharacterized protein n=1 Tax=Chara braunii TaxID=69332 RepID=A0A388LQB3_CHABU|nr:hypothetical protein CBR_g38685 [Chara braunii]|eukprot:GBG84403.1 hypothetical protein CBR_g38685 [Chara braunii]